MKLLPNELLAQESEGYAIEQIVWSEETIRSGDVPTPLSIQAVSDARYEIAMELRKMLGGWDEADGSPFKPIRGCDCPLCTIYRLADQIEEAALAREGE